MSRKLFSAAVLLVLLTLVSQSAHAVPSVPQVTPEGFFAAVWSRLVSVFTPPAPANPDGATRKAGSQMDPNGKPLNAATAGDE